MSGSNPCGQSSSSPIGSQPVVEQNNATTYPLEPQPFGSMNPFNPQTRGSIIGGTSTGVRGSQFPSPLGSTSVFGASSSPAFGRSTSTFAASSGSAIGNSSSSSSETGSSLFGQISSFGNFGGSFQQSQPAFGSNMFGSSTPFGEPSQPAFGPAFSAQTTPAFGSSIANPTFGASTSPFGASTPTFGVSTSSAFGAPSTPAFGATISPAFGATAAPAFVPIAPSFSFGSRPTFAQSTSTFGNTPFGAQTFSFGVLKLESISAMLAYKDKSHEELRWEDYQLGDKGGQRRGSRVSPYSPTPEADGAIPEGTLGSISAMTDYEDKSHEELRLKDYQLGDKGGRRSGSRVSPYSATPEVDGTPSAVQDGKLESISAMSAYKYKSHEELRWEDYRLGDKGGRSGSRVSPYSATPEVDGTPSAVQDGKLESISAMPAYKYKSHEELRLEDYQLGDKGSAPATQTSSFAGFPSLSTPGFGQTSSNPFSSSSPFASRTSNLFGSTLSVTPSLFSNTTQAFGVNSSSSPFSIGSPSSGFGNTQSSPLFQSSTPTLTQTSAPFGQSAPSTGPGNILSTTPSLPNSNSSLGLGPTTPSLSAQPSTSFGGFNIGRSRSGYLTLTLTIFVLSMVLYYYVILPIYLRYINK